MVDPVLSKKLVIGLLDDNPDKQFTMTWDLLERRGHHLRRWRTLGEAYGYLDDPEFGTPFHPRPDRIVADIILHAGVRVPGQDEEDFGVEGRIRKNSLGLGLLRWLSETGRVPLEDVIVLSFEVEKARLPGGVVDRAACWGFRRFLSKASVSAEFAADCIEDPTRIPPIPGVE